MDEQQGRTGAASDVVERHGGGRTRSGGPITLDAMADPVAELCVEPGPLADAVAALPAAPGLYAWWTAPSVLPALAGTPHPVDPDLCALDVGTATMLRNRITRQHLYRSGVSGLRRVLAGRLLEDLSLSPTWAADVILPRADEERLTAWMREHLRLTWCARDDRESVVGGVVEALGPGTAVAATVTRDAEARFLAAAGEKTVRVVGVPFRRP